MDNAARADSTSALGWRDGILQYLAHHSCIIRPDQYPQFRGSGYVHPPFLSQPRIWGNFMYRYRYSTRGILALLLVLAAPFYITRISLAQTTRYVAPHGSDTDNDCTDRFEPCVRIAHAITQSEAGNTIDVAAGFYTEPGLRLDKDLTIRGAGMDETVIQGSSEQPGMPLLKASGLVELERRITSLIQESFRRVHGPGKSGGGPDAAEFASLKPDLRARQRAVADAMASKAGKSAVTETRVLTIETGAEVIFQDLTIRHGLSTAGAGIYNSGVATLDRVSVTRNTVEDPGMGPYGAGIYNAAGAVMSILRSTISKNYTLSDGDGQGGNVFNAEGAEMHVSHTDILTAHGFPFLGGGISNWGNLLVEQSAIRQNHAWENGGGILSVGTLIVQSSLIVGNAAADGSAGSIYGSGDIRNSTISGSFGSRGYGTAIMGDFNISNSTIAYSHSSAQPGSALDGTFHIKSSLLADNTPFECGSSYSPTQVYSHGFNILERISPDGGFVQCSITEVENFSTDIVGADPLEGEQVFDDFGNVHAAVLGIQPIAFGSPAQDAGVCTDLNGNPVTEDQRGTPRFDGLCDIGAYELDPYADLIVDVEAAAVPNPSSLIQPLQQSRESHLSGDLRLASETMQTLVDALHASYAEGHLTSGELQAMNEKAESILHKIGLQVGPLLSCTVLDPGEITLKIGEFDSDQGSYDTREFIDINNSGADDLSLDGCAIVFFDGWTGRSYFAAALDGVAERSSSFRIGNAGVPDAAQEFPANLLQDGPDAVALYKGSAGSFPMGSQVSTTGLLSAIVYLNDEFIFGARKSDRFSSPSELLQNLTEIAASNASAAPESFSLEQNWPNPFNPTTEIRFALPDPSTVRLTVYDALGRRVQTVVDGEMAAGWHTATWRGRYADGSAAPSGVYFYRIEAEDFISTRSMILTK